MTTVKPIRNKKDILKVEKYLAKTSKRDHLLFVIGTNCGLRISDILALNVGDVRNKTYIQIVEKKTGKFKKFPINSKLRPLIADFVKGKRDKEPLFKSYLGNRINRINAYYKRYQLLLPFMFFRQDKFHCECESNSRYSLQKWDIHLFIYL